MKNERKKNIKQTKNEEYRNKIINCPGIPKRYEEKRETN